MITQNVTIQPMYGCPISEVDNRLNALYFRSEMAKNEIIDALLKEERNLLISDIGGIIGEVVAKHCKDNPDEIDDFVDSYSHGVSLATGTHNDSQKNPHRYVKMEYYKRAKQDRYLTVWVVSTIISSIALVASVIALIFKLKR